MLFKHIHAWATFLSYKSLLLLLFVISLPAFLVNTIPFYFISGPFQYKSNHTNCSQIISPYGMLS